jgi:hypothetical protein
VGRNWVDWHRRYDDPASDLASRLAVVVEHLRAAFDGAPAGPVRVLSLCAGDGRDVAEAASAHPRRSDLDAWFVESDPVLASRAAERTRTAMAAARVIRGDAGTTRTFAHAPRADVLLLCGIFGNVGDDAVRATVDAVAMLCRTGATVLWTRHRRPPDLAPAIRSWFAAAGCDHLGLTSPGPGRYAVGAERFVGDERPLDPDLRLFRFTERS